MSEYGSDDDLFDGVDVEDLITGSQLSLSAVADPEVQQPSSSITLQPSSSASQPSAPLKRELSPHDFGGDDVFDEPEFEEIWQSSQQGKRDPEEPVEDDPEHIALANRLLRDKFGYPSFRHEQEKAIAAILRNENALAIFPTGAGKSLCYQIPAIAFPELDKQQGSQRPHGAGLTIVVSPLIALMKDQTDALKKRGIAAECSDSTKTFEQHQQIHADIHSGRLRLLYVSPEKLNSEGFVASMKHVPGGIRLVAVDEAHCISEWGYSFRPQYLKVARFVQEIKAERVICLTATATPRVADDVRAAFGILDRNMFRTSPYRPNLRLEAVATNSKEDKFPLLYKFLREHPGSTIVYVTLQQQAESLADDLRKQGFRAGHYHAGMRVDEKTAVQDKFMTDQIPIVVATIAFGMGIDKASIRNVVHFDLADTVEQYSQQIGRAGRDGRDGYCFLMLCHADFYLRENFARGDLPSRQSLLDLLKDVFTRERSQEQDGEVIKLGHYGLSADYDIRLSPLDILFATLELRFGLLRAITPEYSNYQFEDRGGYVKVAGTVDKSREAKAIYKYAKKSKTLYTFDIKSAMASSSLPRVDIIQKLNSWHDRGIILLKVSGVMNRYRVLQPLPSLDEDIEDLVDDLYSEMEAREQGALDRIKEMVNLIIAKKCFALTLAEHFGMGLPHGRQSCGHCTYCAFGRPPELPPKPTPHVNVDAVKKILAVTDVRDDPRFLARIAFGIKSPKITRLKLDKDPVFMSLADHEFTSLLREFEAACRTSAHGPLDLSPSQTKRIKSSPKMTTPARRERSYTNGGRGFVRTSSNTWSSYVPKSARPLSQVHGDTRGHKRRRY